MILSGSQPSSAMRSVPVPVEGQGWKVRWLGLFSLRVWLLSVIDSIAKVLGQSDS